MSAKRHLAILGLGCALLAPSAIAQTRFAARAPSTITAGAFATVVLFEGGEIFVGRPGEFALFPIPANHAGTVHVFGLDDAGDWSETSVLRSEAVGIGDGFGMSLAVDGNTLLVGAPRSTCTHGLAPPAPGGRSRP